MPSFRRPHYERGRRIQLMNLSGRFVQKNDKFVISLFLHKSGRGFMSLSPLWQQGCGSPHRRAARRHRSGGDDLLPANRRCSRRVLVFSAAAFSDSVADAFKARGLASTPQLMVEGTRHDRDPVLTCTTFRRPALNPTDAIAPNVRHTPPAKYHGSEPALADSCDPPTADQIKLLCEVGLGPIAFEVYGAQLERFDPAQFSVLRKHRPYYTRDLWAARKGGSRVGRRTARCRRCARFPERPPTSEQFYDPPRSAFDG